MREAGALRSRLGMSMLGEEMARATLIGFSAVAMWALLALFTAASGHVPPFMLSAMAFTVGTAVGLVMRFFSRPLPPPLTPPHKGEGDLAALLPSVIRQDLMPSGDAANPPPPCGEGWGRGNSKQIAGRQAMGNDADDSIDPRYAIPDDVMRRKIRESLGDPRPDIAAERVFKSVERRHTQRMKAKNARRSSR